MMRRQMQEMDSIMNQMMGGGGSMLGGGGFPHPFGHNMMRHPDPRQLMIDDHLNRRMMVHQPQPDPFMMPFGGGGGLFGGGLFGGLGNAMGQMEQMHHSALSNPQSHVFSETRVFGLTADGTGQPQYYESTNSIRKAGDVKETRGTVRDTRRGIESISVGRHLGSRGHEIHKERVNGGNIEERQRFHNLNEGEASQFDNEFADASGQTRNRNHANAIEFARDSRQQRSSPYRRQHRQPARNPRGPTVEEIESVPGSSHHRDNNPQFSYRDKKGPIVEEVE